VFVPRPLLPPLVKGEAASVILSAGVEKDEGGGRDLARRPWRER
jgi:hypothetical protein